MLLVLGWYRGAENPMLPYTFVQLSVPLGRDANG
jgi:hypothetical protein